MKIAGGILMALGGIMVALAAMYTQDTGRNSPMTVILGIIFAVAGIVILTSNKNSNKDKNNDKKS